jgi:hypothetical protein
VTNVHFWKGLPGSQPSSTLPRRKSECPSLGSGASAASAGRGCLCWRVPCQPVGLLFICMFCVCKAIHLCLQSLPSTMQKDGSGRFRAGWSFPLRIKLMVKLTLHLCESQLRSEKLACAI